MRQVHGDVGFGETPSPCVLVMLLGTRTPLVWLWVGADGGSIFPPPLSNLVHLIVRTGVLPFRFPPLMLFLRYWHFQAFFLIAEMEKQCEEGGESQHSHLPSSHSAVIVRVRDWDMSLRPTQSRGQPAQPRLWCPPKTWWGDFLCPSELVVLVSLGCRSPSSRSSSSPSKFQYPSVYLVSVLV